MLFITGIESNAQIIKLIKLNVCLCLSTLAGFECLTFSTLVFAAYFLMAQTKSVKMDERIAKFEDKLRCQNHWSQRRYEGCLELHIYTKSMFLC